MSTRLAMVSVCDPRTASMDQRFGERAAGLGDVPVRPDPIAEHIADDGGRVVAGIEDEAERRAGDGALCVGIRVQKNGCGWGREGRIENINVSCCYIIMV